MIYLTKQKAEHYSKSLLSVVIDKPIKERIKILKEAGTEILNKYNTKEEVEYCLYEEAKK